MRKLDKFNYFMLTAVLNLKGFEFKEEHGSGDEVWHNYETNKNFTITKNQKNLSKENLLDILKQAEIPLEEFLVLI